jgi:hypothetical protein
VEGVTVEGAIVEGAIVEGVTVEGVTVEGATWKSGPSGPRNPSKITPGFSPGGHSRNVVRSPLPVLKGLKPSKPLCLAPRQIDQPSRACELPTPTSVASYQSSAS